MTACMQYNGMLIVTCLVSLSFCSLSVVKDIQWPQIIIMLDIFRRLVSTMMLVHYSCGEYNRSANKHFSMVSYCTKPCIYVSLTVKSSWIKRRIPPTTLKFMNEGKMMALCQSMISTILVVLGASRMLFRVKSGCLNWSIGTRITGNQERS